MTYRRITTLLIVFAIFVAITSTQNNVEAARILSQDFSGEIHLATFPSIYEKARSNLAFLLERLPSGPSPRGPGH
ncbi:hypothetical protein RND71_035516 [Anisodus tanguticus]|uniref:Uncharacterized protein n=1 Tax=Anisodus tanguticus TaxID=243964 RepID=A0AAE1V295_9SOLA|nr:hypothetical protein RND71_035516 [Anisodus tanguticus]